VAAPGESEHAKLVGELGATFRHKYAACRPFHAAEEARRKAENDPIGRELRRHIAKIEAELEARR